MFLVGLTGGIASGKSTVAKLMQESGVYIIDADVIAREIVQPGERALRKIRQRFGDEVIDGEVLNRKKLSQIIFNDSQARRDLNRITHPEIYKRIVWRIIKAFLQGRQYVVLDMPLLYETGKFLPFLEEVVVVDCSPEQQMERLRRRNSLSDSEASARISSQIPLYLKAKKASIVIDNRRDETDIADQVNQVIAYLQSKQTHVKNRLIVASVMLGVAGAAFYFCRKMIISLH